MYFLQIEVSVRKILKWQPENVSPVNKYFCYSHLVDEGISLLGNK